MCFNIEGYDKAVQCNITSHLSKCDNWLFEAAPTNIPDLSMAMQVVDRAFEGRLTLHCGG
jgi:hypothetical protein